MPDRDSQVRLYHMRDYANKIGTLVAGKNKEDLEEDEVLCLALTRLIELIGEAANKYPKELQKIILKFRGPRLSVCGTGLFMAMILLTMIFSGWQSLIICQNL